MVISLLFECSVFLIHRWQYWWEKIILWIVSFELHSQFSEFSLVYSFIISCFSIIIWQQLPKTLIFYCFSYIIREVNKKVLKVPGIEQQVKNFPLIFFAYLGFQNFDWFVPVNIWGQWWWGWTIIAHVLSLCLLLKDLCLVIITPLY